MLKGKSVYLNTQLCSSSELDSRIRGWIHPEMSRMNVFILIRKLNTNMMSHYSHWRTHIVYCKNQNHLYCPCKSITRISCAVSKNNIHTHTITSTHTQPYITSDNSCWFPYLMQSKLNGWLIELFILLSLYKPLNCIVQNSNILFFVMGNSYDWGLVMLPDQQLSWYKFWK